MLVSSIVLTYGMFISFKTIYWTSVSITLNLLLYTIVNPISTQYNVGIARQQHLPHSTLRGVLTDAASLYASECAHTIILRGARWTGRSLHSVCSLLRQSSAGVDQNEGSHLDSVRVVLIKVTPKLNIVPKNYKRHIIGDD